MMIFELTWFIIMVLFSFTMIGVIVGLWAKYVVVPIMKWFKFI